MEFVIILVVMGIVGAVSPRWWMVLVAALLLGTLFAVLVSALGGGALAALIIWTPVSLAFGSAAYALRFLPSRKRPRRRPMGLED